MFIFGHTMLTIAAARAIDRDMDLRLPVLMALAPDLIDKPIAWLFPALVNDNSRGFGHTLLGALAVLALLAALRRRLKYPLLLWGCYIGHFLLDRMWLTENPKVLFWPLLGPLPAPLPFGSLLRHQVFLFNLSGEAIGLGILLFLITRRRLFERARNGLKRQTRF